MAETGDPGAATAITLSAAGFVGAAPKALPPPSCGGSRFAHNFVTVEGRCGVEDGIEHIKSYAEIVVHPRCEQWQAEARRYQYKIDRRTQDVLPVPVDAYNHFIDATRYALEPRIRRRTWTLV